MAFRFFWVAHAVVDRFNGLFVRVMMSKLVGILIRSVRTNLLLKAVIVNRLMVTR